MYTLHEADEKLKEVARNIPEMKNKRMVAIEIFEAEATDSIFLAEFEVGSEEASNFLLLIDTLFKTSFPSSSEQDKQRGLYRIEQAYKNEEALPQVAIVTKEPVESRKSKDEKAKKKPTHFSFKWLKVHEIFANKQFAQHKLILCLSIILLLLGSTFVYFYSVNQSAISVQSTSKYETLLKEKKYVKLLEKYPDKEEEILDPLFEEKNKEELKKIAGELKLPLSLFYLSFLEENWIKVTNIQEIPQNKTILGMKAYAYLQQNKLEEAILINKEIKSDTLSEQINKKQIDVAYQALREKDIKTAESLNKEAQSKQLSEDIDVAKSILNLLKKYESDKNNSKLSESDRKEAADNYHMWEKNLQSLGK